MTKEGRTTPINIIRQGDVELFNDYAYSVVGNDDVVCFRFAPCGRAIIRATGVGADGVPRVLLAPRTSNSGMFTEVGFPEFKGWTIHSHTGGKVISLALTNSHYGG